MRTDIINFLLHVCEKYNLPLSLNYYPPNYQGDKHDIYSCHLKGKSVINFTSKNFYNVPKAEREKHFVPLIKVGMAHNLGENSIKEQVDMPRGQGIRVIRDGVRVK